MKADLKTLDVEVEQPSTDYLAAGAESSLAAAQARFMAEVKLLGLSSRDAEDFNAPWEMLNAALIGSMGIANDDGFQVCPSPVVADWNDPNFGDYFAWHVWSDLMPEWSPIYQRTSAGASVAYGMLLGSLEIPDVPPELKRPLEKAAEEYDRAARKYEAALRDVGERWPKFDQWQRQHLPPNRWKSYDEWFAEIGAPQLAPQRSAYDRAAQEYAALINRVHGGWEIVAQAVQNYRNPAYRLAASSPDGLRLAYPTYNINPSLNDFVSESKRLVVEGRRNFSTIQLHKSSYRRRVTETRFGGGGFLFGGFFGLFGGGSYYRQTIDVSHDDFFFELTARNARSFSVNPGAWFNGQVIRAMQNGPWRKDSVVDKWLKGGKPLWGNGGLFPLMTSSLLVVYQPKITIRLSHAEYHSMKERIRGGGVLWIGPFGFGGGYSRSIDDVKFDELTRTIIAEDSSETPKVMAVVASRLPNMD